MGKDQDQMYLCTSGLMLGYGIQLVESMSARNSGTEYLQGMFVKGCK